MLIKYKDKWFLKIDWVDVKIVNLYMYFNNISLFILKYRYLF